MHKAFLLGSSAIAALALATAPANASRFHGWYLSLEAGVSWVDDTNVANDTISNPPAGWVPTTATFDSGWAGMGSLGYAWGNLRAELELGYRSNDLDDFIVTGTNYTGGGDLREFSQMFNVLYDLPLGDRWSITIGGGLGGDAIEYKNKAGFHPVIIKDSDYVFAWQLIGGVNYALSRRTELFVDYRYFNAQEPEFSEFSGPTLHSDFYDDLQKHAVTIGFRMDLSPDEAPIVAAPPPPPPPEPPPAPPPAPQEFIVFFGHDKANITAEGMEVIRQAAAEAKRSGGATIVVTGHADTSGSARHNDALSMRRATNVAKALGGQGISRGSITVEARGESEPAVATGDGVREPQNRRVVIRLAEGSSAPPPADEGKPPPSN